MFTNSVAHFITMNTPYSQNLLCVKTFYEMGTRLLSYTVPCSLPCCKCFPKHLSIPLAGSGAVFHHIDGSVEADRALFHALK